jgi:PAS domain S-box-containing protein
MSAAHCAGRILGAKGNRLFAAAAVVLVAATIGIACLTVYNLLNDALRRARWEVSSLDILLAEQNAQLIHTIELVLRDTRQMAVATGAATPEEFSRVMSAKSVHDYLVEQIARLPQADAISLIDAGGSVVNFSRAWPVPPIDASGREYFQALRDDNKTGVFIGLPFRNSTNGNWDIPIELRINNSAGQFLGVVNTMVEARYFEELYKKLLTNAGESVALFRADGTMIARYPHLEKMMGLKLPANSPWYRFARSQGTYRNPEAIDGVARIVSTHSLGDLPLAVSVTMAEEAEFADWRRQSILIAAGALSSTIALVVFFALLRLQFLRLRQSEARFRGFAVVASDWFWETDQWHRLSYMSEGVSTTGFGVKPNELIGRTRMEIAVDAGGEVAKWREHFAVLDRHEPFRDFRYAWTNTGGQGTASISGDPLFDAKGRFLGYRGTGRDLTPQIRNEQNLRDAKAAAEAANLAKSQFLANISHELRTPLNAVIGFSDMIEHGLAGPLEPKQLEYISLILQSGRHLLRVINDILDLARAESGKFELREDEHVHLGEIVDACVALTRHRAEAGGIALSVVLDDALPALVVDPTRLKQVLLNLLSNAIRFTKAGGSVVISAYRSEDGGVVLEVRDTGIGMTEAEIEIAMEPFGQVDAQLSREHEGTGLGLPLARRFIELHGGALKVQSEKERGTTVTATLPASRTQEARRASAQEQPPGTDADHHSALIVA